MLNDEMNQDKSLTERMEDISEAITNFRLFLEPIDKFKLASAHNFPRDLRYGFDANEDQVIFAMSKNSFRSFEYYQGFEYERNDIAWKIELDGDVIVAYSEDSQRAMKLIQNISEIEES
jgi:hypothetical protein